MEKNEDIILEANNEFKIEKKKKSLNRIFGVFLALSIFLFLILVLEIVLLFIH